MSAVKESKETRDDVLIDRIAEKVVEKINVFKRPVLTRDEAIIYVGKASRTAFDAWRDRWAVRSCSQGRYARAALDAGLAREARTRIAKRVRK